MKKVVALLGTKRKINTYNILLQIKELLKDKDISLEIVELYNYNIKDCIGCEYCINNGSCVVNDDTEKVMKILSNADGIILASPVYLQQVSGKIKTFIDRTCSWYHRPILDSKPILSVSTTKGSGLKATLSYLENVGVQWGGLRGGKLGRSIFNIDKPIKYKELSKFTSLLDNPKRYSPSLSELIAFEVQKSLAIFMRNLDFDYWKKMGWTEKAYFYDCRLNPLKKSISGLIGYSMRKGMSKRDKF